MFPLERLELTEALVALTLAAAVVAYLPAAATTTARDAWLIRAPLGLFAGWITLATVVGTTEALLAEGFAGLGLDPSAWAVLLLVVITGIAAGVTRVTKRGGLAFAVAVTWGLVGVAVAQADDDPTVGAVAAVAALVVAASTAYHRRRGGA